MDSNENMSTGWNQEISMGTHEHNIIRSVGIWPHSSSSVAPSFNGVQFEEEEELGAMKEMMYKMAVMQAVDIDPASVRKPKRRNVRISDDPQSVAARHRRERISEKIRILQRLVPGGTKMDTASMLDEAIRYVKFLKSQIRLLQSPPLTTHNNYCPFAPNTLMPVIGMEFNTIAHGHADPPLSPQS